MKVSKEVVKTAHAIAARPLHRVLIKADGIFVPISHRELDNLVGRLMQMCDLTGDQEQRRALKDTIKGITREWLDQEYETNGYDRWSGVKPDAVVITAE